MDNQGSATEEERYCRKCLLKDMPENAYFENLYRYIADLDEGIKTETGEYQKRLELCRGCSNLIDGMCRICGCFVELRAAVGKNYCPDIERKW